MSFWKVRSMQAVACCLGVEPVQQACFGRAVRGNRCSRIYSPVFTASGAMLRQDLSTDALFLKVQN